MKNIVITPRELAQIRVLADFDLTMLLSDIHDCGWPAARTTLHLMMEAMQKGSVMPHGMSKPSQRGKPT